MSKHSVPTWVGLTEDNELVFPTVPGEDHPRELYDKGAVVFLANVNGLTVLVAPSAEAGLYWMTTMDVPMSMFVNSPFPVPHDPIRRSGPGIQSPHPVRLWVGENGRTIILTDGPLEQGLAAKERFEKAWTLHQQTTLFMTARKKMQEALAHGRNNC